MIITPNSNAVFSEIWEDPTSMISDFRSSYLNKANFSNTSLEILFSQLYAKHGSAHISYMDVEQWKYAVFTIIYNEGMKWQVSRLKQEELESLTDDEILYGGKVVTNASRNPSETGKGTNDTEGLETLNAQDVNINVMNKVVGISGYLNSLKDVTTQFIAKFDKLFSRVITNPGRVMYANYPVEDDEEEDEDND